MSCLSPKLGPGEGNVTWMAKITDLCCCQQRSDADRTQRNKICSPSSHSVRFVLPSTMWNGYVWYCYISGVYEMYIHVWCTTFDLALCTIEGCNVNPPLIAMTYVSMKLKYMQVSLEAESLSDGKRNICNSLWVW